MYSPKIAEDLIPLIYHLAHHNSKPMTHIVDDLLRPQVMKRHKNLTKTKRRNNHEPDRKDRIPANQPG
jgi:hypothetical protein